MTALGRQEEWEDSPEGYPQTRPYKWWNWNDSYVPGAAPDPKWVAVSDAGEAAMRKNDWLIAGDAARVDGGRSMKFFTRNGSGGTRGGRPRHVPGRTGRAAPSGESAYARERCDRSRPPAAADGRGERGDAARRRARRGDVAGRVRGAPAAHRLLLHVVRRPSGAGAVRGLHLLHDAGPRAVASALPRRHLRHVLPGPV